MATTCAKRRKKNASVRGNGQCPTCKAKTCQLQPSGNYNRCTNCHSIGFGLDHQIRAGKGGRTVSCPCCGACTLHEVAQLIYPGEEDPRFIIRRCACCRFVQNEPVEYPAPDGVASLVCGMRRRKTKRVGAVNE